MGLIKQLPEDIAIKIAAGEVVERPASIVKELVENSIDAGASKIEIFIKDGGKTLIEIKDNGSGMDAEDAVKAFLRHGTSKINQVEDLDHVTTLGFRGEALAAISASSEVELITALAGSAEGTQVSIAHCAAPNVRPHAPTPGTRLKVMNLFAMLPARQKFLKSDATEWKACLEVITKQMIAHPRVGFILKHNERLIYDVPSDQELPSRVAETWKIEQSKLVEVNEETPHMQLTGVVAKPETAHDGKARQFFAVNGHPVTDKMIIRSIKEAFGTLLPPGIYPSFALNLAIHPGIVDVNIHPRKDEVRFVNPQEIYRFVFHAVSIAVEQVNVSFAALPETFGAQLEPSIRQNPPFAPRSNSSYSPGNSAPALSNRHFSLRSQATLPEVTFLESQPFPQSNEISYPIISFAECFLISPRNNKLLLIDQHAAHERILYHQLWNQDQEKNVIRQPLLLPMNLDLSPDEEALFQQHKAAFENLGFTFSETNELLEVPQIIRVNDPVQFFHRVLAGITEDRMEPELKDFKHKLFATMACKAAIKAGDPISESEKQQLVKDLLTLPDRFTCPHGRPSYLEISVEEMEKLFKRTGF